eukprot:1158166-Pelagomonas_calceolata.AAC.14
MHILHMMRQHRGTRSNVLELHQLEALSIKSHLLKNASWPLIGKVDSALPPVQNQRAGGSVLQA